jgi:hypothetical protein
VDTKQLKTIPKISVKIWKPIIENLDAKLETACLRRDAYLRKVLEIEVERLDEYVSIPNSQASYNYIAATLDQFDRKLVSLSLPKELTSRLNEICARKRIVRDAFFNRLFLLLVASPEFLDRLLDLPEDWRREIWSDYKSDLSFYKNGFYPLDAEIDPLEMIHFGFELANEKRKIEDYFEPTLGETIKIRRSIHGQPEPIDSLYSTDFHRRSEKNKLEGMNCYLPDWKIPEHSAESEYKKKSIEVLKNLMESL